MTSIIVAFPKLEDAKGIRGLLMRNGFEVQGIANHAAAVISMANELDAGIVICGYKFSDMVYHELNGYLPKGFQMLLVASPQYLQQCRGDEIMKLSMPLKAHELLQTLGMMVNHLERERRRRRKQPKERTDSEKRILNEAKAVLMERNNLTEEEAHKYLQKNSMDMGRSMVETAQMILSLML